MAEPTDPNQTKGQSGASAEAAEGENSELIGLDQLDSMILSEDPSFAEELKEVQAMPNDGSVDLDVVDLGESFIPERENPWKDPAGVRKVIVILLPFLPGLWDLGYRSLDRLQFFRLRFKTYMLQAGPLFLQAGKTAVANTRNYSKTKIASFKSLSRGLKLLAIILIFGCLLTGAFVYRSLTQGVLPEESEFIIASLEEWSGQSYKYDPETEMDSFYDSPRTIQNIMSLPKMVVNLQTSSNSGPNPMAALEFFIEGLSPEAIVEVKDREAEIRDLFQRTIEEVSFDELDSSSGKQLLTEHLRDNLNAILTMGKIRRVFIKEAVIKP